MPRQDAILRRTHVAAEIERVWAAITQAEQIARWFGDSADVDLRVGGSITIGWSEEGVVTSGVVERVDEPNVFAFSWESTSTRSDALPTLVTFTLTSVDGGTEVVVEETGLADLPDDLYDRTLEENSSGWTAELADLVAHVEASR